LSEIETREPILNPIIILVIIGISNETQLNLT